MKKALLVLVLLLLPAPSWAQCPGFPSRGVQIIDAFLSDRDKQALAMGSDDQRRSLTKMIIEQLVFDFPQDSYSWKSADPGRPPSKDSIARTVGGRLCNWDWQNGQTRQRAVQTGQIGEDITGQNPIYVAGVNHLAQPPHDDPQQPQQPALSVDAIAQATCKLIVGDACGRDTLYAQSERIVAHLDAVDQMNQNAIMGKLDAIQADVNNPGWFKERVWPWLKYVGPAIGAVIAQRQGWFGGQTTPQTP